MDALSLLREDHREVEQLFKKVEAAAPDGIGLEETGRQIIEELSRHASVEEQVFYPAVERALPESERAILKSLEAHHAAKSILAEVDRLTAGHDRYQAKLLVLIDSVRQHVAEEEDELFPQVSRALSEDQLNEIGDLMEQAKRVAPTKPHPHAPDTPPGNFLNLAVAVVDQARTAGEKAVRRVTGGRSTGSSRSTGSAKKSTSGAKKTATKASSSAKSTTKSATKSASKSASKSARSGRSTAKSAAKTVTKSARSAGRSASKTASKATRSTGGTAKKSTAKKSSARKSSR